MYLCAGFCTIETEEVKTKLGLCCARAKPLSNKPAPNLMYKYFVHRITGPGGEEIDLCVPKIRFDVDAGNGWGKLAA